MPLPKTVTAQDFICAIDLIDDGFNGCKVADWTSVPFDALLSRARHEAIAECESNNLKKMQEARRDALKEMDDAHLLEKLNPWNLEPSFDSVIKLREEYQTN